MEARLASRNSGCVVVMPATSFSELQRRMSAAGGRRRQPWGQWTGDRLRTSPGALPRCDPGQPAETRYEALHSLTLRPLAWYVRISQIDRPIVIRKRASPAHARHHGDDARMTAIVHAAKPLPLTSIPPRSTQSGPRPQEGIHVAAATWPQKPSQQKDTAMMITQPRSATERSTTARVAPASRQCENT